MSLISLVTRFCLLHLPFCLEFGQILLFSWTDKWISMCPHIMCIDSSPYTVCKNQCALCVCLYSVCVCVCSSVLTVPVFELWPLSARSWWCAVPVRSSPGVVVMEMGGGVVGWVTDVWSAFLSPDAAMALFYRPTLPSLTSPSHLPCQSARPRSLSSI